MPPAATLTMAEYSAGIGVMRIGLAQAGWKTLFPNDIDEKKIEMYRHHFGPSGLGV
jgi:DNA (cytosine-5)-methyltransferase 1